MLQRFGPGSLGHWEDVQPWRVFPSPPAALASPAVLVSNVSLQELSRESEVLGVMALSHTIHPRKWCQPGEERLSNGWWIFTEQKGL